MKKLASETNESVAILKSVKNPRLCLGFFFLFNSFRKWFILIYIFSGRIEYECRTKHGRCASRYTSIDI